MPIFSPQFSGRFLFVEWPSALWCFGHEGQPTKGSSRIFSDPLPPYQKNYTLEMLILGAFLKIAVHHFLINILKKLLK